MYTQFKHCIIAYYKRNIILLIKRQLTSCVILLRIKSTTLCSIYKKKKTVDWYTYTITLHFIIVTLSIRCGNVVHQFFARVSFVLTTLDKQVPVIYRIGLPYYFERTRTYNFTIYNIRTMYILRLIDVFFYYATYQYTNDFELVTKRPALWYPQPHF